MDDRSPDSFFDCVPFNSDSLLYQCQNEIGNLRKNIIRIQREIVIKGYYQDPDKKGILYSNSESLKSCFNPKELKSQVGFSQVLQTASFMISYLLENPEHIVQIINNNTRISSFSYFISKIIPSLFGFFSSKEYLELCLPFYLHLLRSSPYNISVAVLIPFLNSGVTYRFFEASLSPFFLHFVVEFANTPEESSKHLISKFSNMLLDSFIRNIPLLPEEVLSILRLYSTTKSSEASLELLFLNSFLWKMTYVWFESFHVPSLKVYLDRIISFSGNQKEKLIQLYKEFYRGQSRFQIPNLYRNFEIPYNLYFICVKHLIFLNKMLSKVDLLPQGLRVEQIESIPKEFYSQWIWVQVYPRQNSSSIIPSLRLIFPKIPLKQIDSKDEFMVSQFRHKLMMLENHFDGNPIQYQTYIEELEIKDFSFYSFIQIEKYNKIANAADHFEELIHLKHLKNELDNWFGLLSSQKAISFSNTIEIFLNQRSQKHIDDSKSFISDKSQIIESISLQKHLLLCTIDFDFEKKTGKQIIVLDRMDDQWTKLVLKLPKIMDLPHFQTLLRNITEKDRITTWNCIKSLGSIGDLTLSCAFTVLIDSISKLRTVSEDPLITKQFILYSFNQMQGKKFLSTFTKINSLAIGNILFSKWWNQNETECWFELEKVILECLSHDNTLLNAFMEVQQILQFQQSHSLD